jgi:hypothetical protein
VVSAVISRAELEVADAEVCVGLVGGDAAGGVVARVSARSGGADAAVARAVALVGGRRAADVGKALEICGCWTLEEKKAR